MEKLGEITSNSEKLKIEKAESYKNIKSVEKVSDEDVDDFWSKEFAKEGMQFAQELYEELISEIYNCSEDEIEIDFEIDDRLETLLENFKPDIWMGLTDVEKLCVIKGVVCMIGEKLGLVKIPEILVFEDENGYFGSYDYAKNVINLNQRYLNNPLEVLDTITHEIRHAYQHMRAEFLETREDVLFYVNFENYISPRRLSDGGYLFFTDYYNQYVEVDARAFANIFREAIV